MNHLFWSHRTYSPSYYLFSSSLIFSRQSAWEVCAIWYIKYIPISSLEGTHFCSQQTRFYSGIVKSDPYTEAQPQMKIIIRLRFVYNKLPLLPRIISTSVWWYQLTLFKRCIKCSERTNSVRSITRRAGCTFLSFSCSSWHILPHQRIYNFAQSTNLDEDVPKTFPLK